MRVDVRADLRAVNRDLNRVQRRMVPRAAATGLNRANRTLRSRIVRAIGKALGVRPIRRIRRRVPTPKSMAATQRRLRTGGLVLFRWLPAIYELHTKSARKAAQGPNRWLGEMPTGKVGIWRRTGRARFPIREVHVDRERQALEAADKVIGTDGAPRFRIEFTRALKRLLRRK